METVFPEDLFRYETVYAGGKILGGKNASPPACRRGAEEAVARVQYVFPVPRRIHPAVKEGLRRLQVGRAGIVIRDVLGDTPAPRAEFIDPVARAFPAGQGARVAEKILFRHVLRMHVGRLKENVGIAEGLSRVRRPLLVRSVKNCGCQQGLIHIPFVEGALSES